MKKLRVFQTVKKNRIVPGLSIKNLGTVLLLLFLLPYLLTFLFGNLQNSKENLEKWWPSFRWAAWFRSIGSWSIGKSSSGSKKCWIPLWHLPNDLPTGYHLGAGLSWGKFTSFRAVFRKTLHFTGLNGKTGRGDAKRNRGENVWWTPK